jgi:hypothetical protein
MCGLRDEAILPLLTKRHHGNVRLPIPMARTIPPKHRTFPPRLTMSGHTQVAPADSGLVRISCCFDFESEIVTARRKFLVALTRQPQLCIGARRDGHFTAQGFSV